MTELEKLYDRLGTRNIPGSDEALKIFAGRIEELVRSAQAVGVDPVLS